MRRAQDPGVGKAHADGVAGEQQAAVGVVQGEMMLGVPGGVDGGEDAIAADAISSPSSSTWTRSAGVGSRRP